MVDYDELYEYLRKEKYSEQLQPLPKIFVKDVGEYFSGMKKELSEGDMFSDDVLGQKKQFENAISIFKELMLRRKKKILNLVFVASETGIMKRDFSNMLAFEQGLFENLVQSVDECDKELNGILSGGNGVEEKVLNKMVIFSQDIEAFMGMDGNQLGPFVKGDLANIDSQVAEILVSEGKADFVDE